MEIELTNSGVCPFELHQVITVSVPMADRMKPTDAEMAAADRALVADPDYVAPEDGQYWTLVNWGGGQFEYHRISRR